jgi:cytochrome c-type biogenesis protein CcmH
MRNKVLVTALGVFMLAAALARGQAPPPTLESVGNKVMCICGCVAILNQCPHQGCGTHDEIQAAIKNMIAEGKSESEIMDALAARYGKKILAAPSTAGFDLTAWILPGIGLIFGLLAVIFIVRRLRQPAAVAAAQPAAVDPKVLAALEEEMKSTGLESRRSD